MKTDTPRTYAAEPQLYSNAGGWVKADFARELERELAESQAQSHGLARRVVEAETMLEVVQAELKDATEWLDERYKALSEADDRAEKAEAEAQRLRDLLEKVLFELEKVPFQTPKLTAFTAHRLADRYREQLNQINK